MPGGRSRLAARRVSSARCRHMARRRGFVALSALLGCCSAQEHSMHGAAVPDDLSDEASIHAMQMSVGRLAELLAAPFDHLALTRQAVRSEQLSVTVLADLRGWLLHQALVHEHRPAAERRDTFYFVGLETGAFEGFVYSVPASTQPLGTGGEEPVSLLFSQRLPGSSAPSDHNWDDIPDGSTWFDASECARGRSCTHMPADVFLADSCPATGSACSDVDGCAEWSCADSGVRLDFHTDGIFQTNRVPDWYLQQSVCTEAEPCTVAVDPEMVDADQCQLKCQQHQRCDYFSYQYEVTDGRYFHRCFLKVALSEVCYTDWNGSSGPKMCPTPGVPCILSCKDYGGPGGGCDTADVVGLVLNKRDWRAQPVRWTAPFDPRTRPWYQQAKDAAQIPILSGSGTCTAGAVTAPANGTLERWSEIYMFAGDDAGLGISATSAVLSRHGDALLGVLGIDYSLRAISAWLSREFSGTAAVTFIVQQGTGYMVASSTGENVKNVTTSPLHHGSPLVRYAARWMESQGWSVPAHSAKNHIATLPPTEWMLQNSEFVQSVNEDSVLRIHVNAQNVTGDAVKNLRWILLSAEVQLTTCGSIASSGNLMVPDSNHLECLCRKGYRPIVTQENATSCSYCSESDPICHATSTRCIRCFGGAAVVARAGFYIESGSVFSCDRKRCVGPDEGYKVNNSQSFGKLTPALCGDPSRALPDGLGNCCAVGHHGKLCAYCNTNFEWSGTRCIECASPDLLHLAWLVASQCLLITWISISKHNRITPRWSGEPWRSRPNLFVPLHDDLPLETGGEVQNLSFWWQTFNMLGVSEDSGSMATHIINLVFGMDLGTGVSPCLFPFRSFFLRYYVNLLLPPAFHIVCALACDRCISFRRSVATRSSHHLRAVMFDIAVLNMTPTLQKAFKHWYCTSSDDRTPFGDTPVLHNAPFMPCSGIAFQISRVVAVCVSLLFGVAFPLWVGVQLRKRKNTVVRGEDDADDISDLHDRCTLLVTNIPSSDCRENKLMGIFNEHGVLTVTCHHHTGNRLKSAAHAVHAQSAWGSVSEPAPTARVGAMVYHRRYLFGMVTHIEDEGCIDVKFENLKTTTSFETFASAKLVLVPLTDDGEFDREAAVAIASAGFEWALVSFRSPALASWALRRGWTRELGDSVLTLSRPNMDEFQAAEESTHKSQLWKASRQKFKQHRELLSGSGYGSANKTGLSAVVGNQVATAKRKKQRGSIYWSSTASGSKCRRDWLVSQYSNVREECWWWNAGLLLRRSWVALVFSRRNLVDFRGGTQFEAPAGFSADWRVCIVVIMCVNLFLSGYSDPYRFMDTNTFNDLSIYLLIVLYVGQMMNETNFFMTLGMLSLFFLALSFGLVMLVKSQTVSGWDRARSAAMTKSVSPSFLDRRKRAHLKNVVVPQAENTAPEDCENESDLADDANHLSALRQLQSNGGVNASQPKSSSVLPPLSTTRMVSGDGGNKK